MDPSGLGSSKLAADILWSDPGKESGLRENDERGIGLVFGPDVTEVGVSSCPLSDVSQTFYSDSARYRNS